MTQFSQTEWYQACLKLAAAGPDVTEDEADQLVRQGSLGPLRAFDLAMLAFRKESAAMVYAIVEHLIGPDRIHDEDEYLFLSFYRELRGSTWRANDRQRRMAQIIINILYQYQIDLTANQCEMLISVHADLLDTWETYTRFQAVQYFHENGSSWVISTYRLDMVGMDLFTIIYPNGAHAYLYTASMRFDVLTSAFVPTADYLTSLHRMQVQQVQVIMDAYPDQVFLAYLPRALETYCGDQSGTPSSKTVRSG
jgi:hypothetical protein